MSWYPPLAKRPRAHRPRRKGSARRNQSSPIGARLCRHSPVAKPARERDQEPALPEFPARSPRPAKSRASAHAATLASRRAGGAACVLALRRSGQPLPARASGACAAGGAARVCRREARSRPPCNFLPRARRRGRRSARAWPAETLAVLNRRRFRAAVHARQPRAKCRSRSSCRNWARHAHQRPDRPAGGDGRCRAGRRFQNQPPAARPRGRRVPRFIAAQMALYRAALAENLSGQANRLRAGLDRRATPDAPARCAARCGNRRKSPSRSAGFIHRLDHAGRRSYIPTISRESHEEYMASDQSHRWRFQVRSARFQNAGRGGFLGGMVRPMPHDRGRRWRNLPASSTAS